MGILMEMVGGLTMLLAPVIGLLIFFIIYEEFRPLARSIHLDQRIVVAFIVGSVFAIGSIPLIASGKGWLMLNMSGAVIPAGFAIYLWVRNRLNILLVSAGIGVTAFVTYIITSVVPDIGIGAKFPDFLLPVLVAVLFSISYGLVGRKEKALPMSFTVACLGTLIGADLVRIPHLVYDLELGGNIGGARTLDLVLVCPLLAFFLSFILIYLLNGFSRRKLLQNYNYRPRKTNWDDRWIHRRFTQGYECLEQGKRRKAMFYALDAVRKKLHLVAGLYYSSRSVLQQGGNPSWVLENAQPITDYNLLERNAKERDQTPKKAYNSLLTAQMLLIKLDNVRKLRLATNFQRIAAFLMDQLFLISITALIYTLWMRSLSHPVDPDETIAMLIVFFIFPFSIWASFQLPYFILFELFTERTPGKWIVGIRIMEVGKARTSLEAVIARNVVRYFEMLGGFYIISLIVIGFSKNRQRIGDMVAKTVVVRKKKRDVDIR
ncbi:MAG: RDD family protein [Candidatus Thermoplasmatota archaeon]|jgi:uncharacterized membrane protein/uncharacterized RDD family membrane protein YckC|nr:RDD family protein [Candidatus Thermoplasmatota archaeon]